MNPILENLNPDQLKAVTHVEGPMLVMAGAGSGKTKVLTHRIAYLIKEVGVSPFNILAITFTNKAAKEMKDRVIGLVGNVGKKMYISTFHSMCVHILRQDIYHLDYKDNFVIYDENDQISLIKKILINLNIDQKMYTPKRLANAISGLKNDYIFPSQLSAMAKKKYDDFSEILAKVYTKYQEELKTANALDFDDLIMLTIQLFEMEPTILSFYQEKFKFILVDEYQDTNVSQFRLVELLARKHKNVFVVGDTDQSIYSWRGASIRNIIEFERDFTDENHQVKIIYLEQNYRSYQHILDCANAVIQNNYETGQKVKKLWSNLQDTEQAVVYYRAINSDIEVEYIADKIQSLVRNGYRYSDIAVLYRTNALSLNLEKTFKRYKIDYQIIGNVGYFERKEVKDLIAYLRLILNPEDNVSFMRVVNEPRRGIGKTTLDYVTDYAFKNQISLYQAAIDINTLSNRAKESLMSFIELIESFRSAIDEMTVHEVIEQILEKSNYLPTLRNDQDEESESRIENLQEFKTLALDLEESLTADDVLAQKDLTTYDKLALILNTLTLSNDTSQENRDAVKLMTVHAAKGLEFPVVFIYAVEENIFPLHSIDSLDEDIEEERRLMYVAITRAKQALYITNAEIRKLYGDYRVNMESRFIKEMDQSKIQREGIHKSRLTRTNTDKKIEKPVLEEIKYKDQAGQAKAGTKVRHRKFGVGVIINISGEIAQIAFPAPHGIKKLDINHPAIEIL